MLNTRPHAIDPPPINPYAVPGTTVPLVPYKPKRLPQRKRTVAARALAGLMVFGTMPAAAIACYDIESIVISGPIFLAASIILLILAHPRPLRCLYWVAVPTLLYVIGCFLTIAGLQWSPGEAQTPVSAACVVFALVLQSGWIPVLSLRDADPYEV